jgi:hypothetical protein
MIKFTLEEINLLCFAVEKWTERDDVQLKDLKASHERYQVVHTEIEFEFNKSEQNENDNRLFCSSCLIVLYLMISMNSLQEEELMYPTLSCKSC